MISESLVPSPKCWPPVESNRLRSKVFWLEVPGGTGISESHWERGCHVQYSFQLKMVTRVCGICARCSSEKFKVLHIPDVCVLVLHLERSVQVRNMRRETAAGYLHWSQFHQPFLGLPLTLPRPSKGNKQQRLNESLIQLYWQSSGSGGNIQ